MFEILGVVKDVPVPRTEPPVTTEYQFNVPALAAALSVTEPLPQRLLGVVFVIVGDGFTLTTTDFVSVQPLLPVTVTVYVPAELTKRVLFVLLSFHLYVPPPVPVNVVLLPEQKDNAPVILAVVGVLTRIVAKAQVLLGQLPPSART